MSRRKRRLKDRGWLGRWAAYRRWGPRKNWTGNNAHDITVTDRGEDWHGGERSRFYATGWTTCRCGKVRAISTDGQSDDLVRTMLELKGEMCRPCSAWTHKRANWCPDGNCTLGYEHKGRCQPLPPITELRRAALIAADVSRDHVSRDPEPTATQPVGPASLVNEQRP